MSLMRVFMVLALCFSPSVLFAQKSPTSGSSTVTVNPTGGTTTLRPRVFFTKRGEVITPFRRYSTTREYYASSEFHRYQRRCATRPSGRTMGRSKALVDCNANQTIIRDIYDYQVGVRVIPVVFHNIMRQDGTGLLDQNQILSQVRILNEDFGAYQNTPGDGQLSEDTHIRFVLAGITRVKNNAWFDFPEDNETSYKSQLSWDPDEYLNIFTAGSQEGTLGWAAFPFEDAGSPSDDGVVLLWDTVGEDAPGFPYDMGRTATHEVGHYLGLFHTFYPSELGQNSCGNTFASGDRLQDTPAQGDATYGCPGALNSCGGDASDNLANYMNYTDDVCMSHFTPQQSNRMMCSILNYRSSLGAFSPIEPHTSVGDKKVGQYNSGGTIHILKKPIPNGLTVHLSMVGNKGWDQNEPEDLELRVHYRRVDNQELVMVGSAFTNGFDPAELSFNVPDNTPISLRYSVRREGSGSRTSETSDGARGGYSIAIRYQ